MNKLLRSLRPFLIFALLGPIAIIGEVLLEIRIPLLMADIVDVGITNRDIDYVLRQGGLMLLMSLISLAFGASAAYLSARGGIGFGSEVRKSLFNKVQSFSYSNIDRFSTASLITRLTTDVNNLQNAFIMCIRLLVRAPVMLVSATLMAYSIKPNLVTIFFAAIPFLVLCMSIIMVVAFPRFEVMLKKYDKLNASVQENLIGIRVVKAFVRAPYEKKKFKDTNDAVMQAQMRAERVVVMGFPLMMFTMFACITAILWFGGQMIISQEMEVGQLLSFITYITQVLISLMMLSMVLVTMVISRASVGRIIEVLNESSDISDGGEPSAEVADGSIEFVDVAFQYSAAAEELTLEGINLRIAPGETVGVIGGTGSAKTTLVQLIPRLYDTTGGTVLVGGRDVREYRLDALRNAVGMVLQKNVLFTGPIIENLRWGNPEASMEEVEWACKAAAAHDFITSFPNGYDTELGQGGVNVSGGQKQRLCIARALLKRPKILILDDSTSAVDTATDAKIRASFAAELADTTKIIIAQRIASVRDADKIVVMDDGHISDIGSHEELLERSEIYRDVFTSQQKGVAQ